MSIGLIITISTQNVLKTYKKNRVQNSTFWALINRVISITLSLDIFVEDIIP